MPLTHIKDMQNHSGEHQRMQAAHRGRAFLSW